MPIGKYPTCHQTRLCTPVCTSLDPPGGPASAVLRGDPAEHLPDGELKGPVCQEDLERRQIMGVCHDGAVAEDGS